MAILAFRDTVRDLLSDGTAMIAGGYLKLLRFRRDPDRIPGPGGNIQSPLKSPTLFAPVLRHRGP
jgi:hypothetical protein